MFKLMILDLIKLVPILPFKNAKNKEKEDTWTQSSKIILIVMPVIVKNTSIMDLLFIKIRKELLQKKTNKFYMICKEKGAIQFTISDRLQTKRKSKILFSINRTLIISCKIFLSIHNLL
jgi:hypothetical protein